MHKLVKVGNVIYNDGNVVSQRTYGSWYKKVKKKNGFEFETVSEEDAKIYDEMLDCLKMPLSESELHILDVARSMLEANTRLSSDDRKSMLKSIEEGVVMGLRRYGPYNPKLDTRDLRKKIREKARNVIVYSIMLLMKDPNSAPTTTILIRQAMIIWSFTKW